MSARRRRSPPPKPPADLNSRTPRLLTLGPGTIVHRFYTTSNDPLYFDRSLDGRLNAPDGSYGVLYAAAKANGAFAETFLRTTGRRMIDPKLTSKKGYVAYEVVSPLNIIEFDGPGLAIVGATAEVVHCGGPPYPNPQSWSLALHSHPMTADGIAYGARHDPHEVCYAIFDRAGHAIREVKREVDLDQSWFWDLADGYGMGQPPS